MGETKEEASRPSFEVKFAFERSLVALADGTYFAALRDAARRWDHAYRRMWTGPRFKIVYELVSGEFLYLEYEPGSSSRGERGETEVWESRTPPQGQKIPPEYAFNWLIQWEEAIPDSLSHIPAEIAARRLEPEPEPENRPLEYWAKSLPEHPIHEIPREDAEFRALTQKVAEGAVKLIHEVRIWTEGAASQKLPEAVIRFLVTLRSQYLIDPNNWWGDPAEIPPRLAGIEDLPWPFEMGAMQKPILELKNLVLLPLLLLAQSSRPKFGNNYYPTSGEVQNARQMLVRDLGGIEKTTLAIRKALAGVEIQSTDDSTPVAETPDSKAGSQLDEASAVGEFTQDFLDEVATISAAQWEILSLMQSQGCDGTNPDMRWPTQDIISSWLGNNCVTATLKANLSSLTKHKWLHSRRGNQLGGGYILTSKGLRALRFREAAR